MDPKKPSHNILKDNPRLVYTGVAVAMMLAACASIIYWYVTLSTIESKSEDLIAISNYSFSSLSSNDMLKNEYPLWRSLSDALWYDDRIQDEIKKSKEQREKLSLPYNNFLHFLYTPSLNIWRDPFSGDIDTTLVGEKYLLNNPYSDIELIQKRTNFFKDMWVVDQYNTINDISLGTLEPVNGGFFALPITVQFETPDRRSFLLLVSKLSMTSYAENVSLINEYMFYLRESIKKNKMAQIQDMLDSGELPSLIKTEDQLIGYLLYQWIKQDKPITIINNEIINEAISRSAWCTDQTPEECLYLFRDKFRSVPYLAYGIARDKNSPMEWLKQFLINLPPLISIDSFSFDQNTQKGKKTRDEGYKWSISIKVYGRDLWWKEVEEISQKLGSLCFQDKTSVTSSYGLLVVNKLIDQLGQQDAINAKRSTQLNDMLLYLKKIDGEYEGLTNYKKVIRLFEVYRTLQESNACDLMVSEKDLKTPGLQSVDNSPLSLPVNAVNEALRSSVELISLGTGSFTVSGSLTNTSGYLMSSGSVDSGLVITGSWQQ